MPYGAPGTIVSIRRPNGPWLRLNGYAGGLMFGQPEEKVELARDDDGSVEFIRGNRTGVDSTITVFLVPGDAGQELLRELAGPSEGPFAGLGSVQALYPQGRVVEADGLFYNMAENPIDPDAFQGFSVNFVQHGQERES